MRILLVENDPSAAQGITKMLKADGAIVDHCMTGEESLELARRYEYDIVLLELMLPDMEGYDVVCRLRVSRNNTPVLVVSAHARAQAKVKCLGLPLCQQ